MSPKRPQKSAKIHPVSAQPWRKLPGGRQQHGRPALLRGRPPFQGSRPALLLCTLWLLLQPPSLSPGELSCQNASVRRPYACFLSSQALFFKTFYPTLVVSRKSLSSLAYINPPHLPFTSTPNLLEKFSKRIILSLSRTWV